LGDAGNPRLLVIDSASVDRHRRLILIRRDNVEHLLMVGGPADVVVETMILRVAGEPLELPVTHSPAAAERQPRAISQPDKGSRPLPPEQMAIPRPAPQIQPPAPTRPQRDTLAAPANELSNRAPVPPKGSATAARPHRVEPGPELRSEPGLELRSEPGTEPRSESGPKNGSEYRVETQAEPPQPAQQPTAAEAAPSADEELAELARLLEAKLRKPNVPGNARPSAAPARLAPSPQLAPAAEAVPRWYIFTEAGASRRHRMASRDGCAL
jgi:flagellar protein FliO/FliZ